MTGSADTHKVAYTSKETRYNTTEYIVIYTNIQLARKTKEYVY